MPPPSGRKGITFVDVGVAEQQNSSDRRNGGSSQRSQQRKASVGRKYNVKHSTFKMKQMPDDDDSEDDYDWDAEQRQEGRRPQRTPQRRSNDPPSYENDRRKDYRNPARSGPPNSDYDRRDRSRGSRDSRDRNSRDQRDSRDGRYQHDSSRDGRDSRDRQGSRGPRRSPSIEDRGSRDSRDGRSRQSSRDSRDPRGRQGSGVRGHRDHDEGNYPGGRRHGAVDYDDGEDYPPRGRHPSSGPARSDGQLSEIERRRQRMRNARASHDNRNHDPNRLIEEDNEEDTGDRRTRDKEREKRKKRELELRAAMMMEMEPHSPVFIKLTALICILLFGYCVYLNGGFEEWTDNPFFGPSQQTLLDMGAKYAPLILEGEYWRLGSAMFLHVGVIHLFMNMSFQLKAGTSLEMDYGWGRILPIYLLSGLCGNLASSIFLPQQVQVGASGALYGLLGVLFSDLIQNWSLLASPCSNLMSMLMTLVISLGMGLLPAVDNFAHMGGFVCGVLSGIIFLPTIHFGCFNQLLTMLALPALIIYIVTLSVVFFGGTDGNSWCDTCQKINCLDMYFDCEAALSAQTTNSTS